jgi:tetratricopeptide (TPR) repeat protein
MFPETKDPQVSDKPPFTAAMSPPSPTRSPEQAGEHPAGQPEAPPRRTYRRSVVVALELLVVALGLGGLGLGLWAYRAEEKARVAAVQAEEERQQALKAVAEAKVLRDQAEVARQAASRDRDQELQAELDAQRNAEATQAVLAFLRDKVLSAGRPREWAGGQGKDVTLRQAMDAAEAEVAKVLGKRPLAEAALRSILGSTYQDLGELASAVKQFERALALREAMLGIDHVETVACRNQLAVAYRLAGRPLDASRLYDRHPDTPAHAAALAGQAAVLLTQDKPVEAELKLRECLGIRQRIQPEDWTTFDAKSMLGEALLAQKKYAEAEPLLLTGYEGLKQRADKLPPEGKVRLSKAVERLVRLHEAEDKKDKADFWRKELAKVEGAKKP